MEKAFEIIRPINPKTGKLGQGFVIKSQKEELIEPSRKNNGKTRLVCDDDFNQLWYRIIKENIAVLGYYNQLQYAYKNEINDINVYLSNSLIYDGFGIDTEAIYSFFASKRTYSLNIFQSIFFNCIRALIIKRLLERYSDSTHFEKGIIRKIGLRSKGYVIDNSLLTEFNLMEQEGFDNYKVKSVFEAQCKGVYTSIMNDIAENFKQQKLYGVRRTNKIRIPKSEVEIIMKADDVSLNKIKKYQFEFCITLISQIWKSVQERITNEEKYKDFCLTGRQQLSLGCIYLDVKKILLKPYLVEYPDNYFAFQVKPFSCRPDELSMEDDEIGDWIDILEKYDTFQIEQTREYMLEHLNVSV